MGWHIKDIGKTILYRTFNHITLKDLINSDIKSISLRQ